MKASKIKYAINLESNLIIGEAKGELEFEDFVFHMQDLSRDDDFKHGLNGLYDFSQISRISGDVSHWEKTSELITKNPNITDRVKVAIITANNQQLESLFSGWKIMMEFTLVQYETFENIDTASNWLEIKI